MKVHFGIASPLQTETANASMDSPTAIKNNSIKPKFFSFLKLIILSNVKIIVCGNALPALGGFQALMPAIGYVLGAQFQETIASIDHWIAFVLLALIGGNMIHEALDNDEEEADASLDVKTMFLLAVATSIDALAIGITFAFLKVNIIPAVCFIGIVTFIISFAGVKIGNVFGARYKNKAEIVGGIILILLGLKILLEHLGFLE